MSASTPQVLYTPAQRARRDASAWTMVQGVLAPFQFAVFLASLYLVLASLSSAPQRSLTASLEAWSLPSSSSSSPRRYPRGPMSLRAVSSPRSFRLSTVASAAAAVTTAQSIVTKIEQGDIVAESTDTAEEAQAAYLNAQNAAVAAEAVVAKLEAEIAAAEEAIAAVEEAQAAVDSIKQELEEAMNNGDTELVAKLEAELAVAETTLSETQGGEAFFEGPHRGIGEARVDVARHF